MRPLLLLILPLALHIADGWSYGGQRHWARRYPLCAGQNQSPVDITTSRLRFDPSLTPLKFEGFSKPLWRQTLLLDDHSLRVKFTSDRLKISGGGLPGTFITRQLHFHWGSDSQHGSEHKIDGKAAPMELHMVSYTASPGYSGSYGMAVVSILFEISTRDNPAISNLLASLKTSKRANVRNPLAISDLLPRDQGSGTYFRYTGSITTPPCSETVLWTILQSRASLSEKQLSRLRDMIKEDNWRRVQPINSRDVYTNNETLT